MLLCRGQLGASHSESALVAGIRGTHLATEWKVVDASTSLGTFAANNSSRMPTLVHTLSCRHTTKNRTHFVFRVHASLLAATRYQPELRIAEGSEAARGALRQGRSVGHVVS